MLRRSLMSGVTALAFSAVLALPSLAAAPTYSGILWCTSNGEPTDMGPVEGWTKKQLNEWGRHWESTGFCDKGSTWDTSQLTKD